MKRKKLLKLTEGDKEFVKDFSRKLILRAYLTSSAKRSRTLSDRLKQMFTRKLYNAPVIDILDVIEKQRK